jgi:hypothetical protein
MWPPFLAVLLILVTLIGIEDIAPVAAAPARACQVRNRDTGADYPKLRGAVRAARGGDRLVVQGLCRGGAIIKRDLSFKGVRKGRSGKPTLSGVGKSRVLTITPGTSVKLRGLLIVRGKALVRARAGGGDTRAARARSGHGGAVLNRGSLTLIDVQVRRSTAGGGGSGSGGGIHNTGRLILRGETTVTRNFAPIGGGVKNDGMMLMIGSSGVIGNGADDGGGVTNTGRLVMAGRARISRNGAGADGGVTNTGRFVMNDESTIGGNSGGLDGGAGGVSVARDAILVMNDASSIRGNASVEASGGGVANAGGIVRLNDSATIAANTALACGGVAHEGRTARFTMNDESSIDANTATGTHGGGVCVRGGRFVMTEQSTITENAAPDKVDDIEGTYRGGGIYHSGGTLAGVGCGPHTDANVYLNTPDDCRRDAP